MSERLPAHALLKAQEATEAEILKVTDRQAIEAALREFGAVTGAHPLHIMIELDSIGYHIKRVGLAYSMKHLPTYDD